MRKIEEMELYHDGHVELYWEDGTVRRFPFGGAVRGALNTRNMRPISYKLFPNHSAFSRSPELTKRSVEWIRGVLNECIRIPNG